MTTPPLMIAALRILARDGRATDAQLGDRLFDTGSAHRREAAARRTANALVERGLATPRKDPHGRRVLLVTVGGRDLLRTLDAASVAADRRRGDATAPGHGADGPEDGKDSPRRDGCGLRR